MKMKKIYFALLALGFMTAACDIVELDGPKSDNQEEQETGAQVYIDNATTTFYVKTAEEKAEKKESLAALTGKRFGALETPADDSEIALPIIRKNATGEYDCEVNLYMGSNLSLFTVKNISYENDGVETKVPVSLVTADFDGDKKDDGGTVKFTFPDEIDRVNVLIGFDIKNGIAANVDYEFEAWLGEEVEGTPYGANDFKFIIKHSAPVHDPWVVIGKVSMTDTFWNDGFGVGLPPQSISIAIHEHDFTDDSFIEKDGEKVINPDKTKRKLKDQAYYRFCVPSVGYQLVASSIENGDGIFAEEELEYLENARGFMFQVDKNYDLAYDITNKTYADPLAEDVAKGGASKLYPMLGYDANTGKCDFWIYDGYILDPSGYALLTDPGYFSYWAADFTHSASNYIMMPLFCNAGTPWNWGYGFNFDWTDNELVDNWSNFFKVNYDFTDENCDINYIQSASGSVASEIAGTTIEGAFVAEGYDVLYKNNVYSVVAAPKYALAVLVGADGKAKLAADQPFPDSALGDKLYASQSDKYLSSVEFDEKGAIKTITLGVKIHYEGSDVAIKEYKEVFTADATTLTIDDFCGTYTQYSNLIEEDGTGIIPYMPINYYNSEVTISKISDTKVKISGIILSDKASNLKGGADAYIEANFNPSTAMLEIPAQYIMTANGKDAVYFEHPQLPGMKFFCYFQPGVTDYNQYSDKTYFGYLYEQTSDIGLAFNSDGQLELCPTKNTESEYAPDGYNVQFYVPDGEGGFALDEQYLGELYCTFATTVLVPAGAPSGIAPKALEKKIHVNAPSKKAYSFKLK